ncbi:GNAT family N-acetyltransferase [Pseudomonas quasicaspiana]|uniref:GNAT family N-acetyltransferase n=1 Tax=Pseudomonas quasicaspiana TaxID=2829821 RepID=UPI001E3AAFFA|nr:GNAT family N-acetyltransferase [Pseudomonas quasicaspiana]MCD5975597.1 GNAT family N-acetyltransferase [Pseudomonas quasicaspiana]
MHNYYFRLSCAEDVPDLCRISAEARLRYRTFPSLAHIAEAPALAPLRFEACRVVLALDSNSHKIMGFAAMRPLDGLLYLDNISVRPSASGMGIGANLLSAAIEHAESLGVRAVSLTTFREPPWNGPWFRKHGFLTMPGAYIGEGLKQVMDRQRVTLDATTRETLWRVLHD